jgi:uncharacterized protein (DUF1697 family)
MKSQNAMNESRTTGKILALLRGINVGGKNKLPMKDLGVLFEAVGCTDVRTFIQSGNVVFRAPNNLMKTLPLLISKGIEKRFGYKIPVLIRTTKELATVIQNNPFPEDHPHANSLHVFFLADTPAAPSVAALDPNRSPGDSFIVRGREIYAIFHNGAGRSKLTNTYFDAKLSTTSTARNWRTIHTLFDLLN